MNKKDKFLEKEKEKLLVTTVNSVKGKKIIKKVIGTTENGMIFTLEYLDLSNLVYERLKEDKT